MRLSAVPVSATSSFMELLALTLTQDSELGQVIHLVAAIHTIRIDTAGTKAFSE
jgi:hypothetical protein